MRTRSMTFRVPEDLAEQLIAVAKAKGITLTEEAVARMSGGDVGGPMEENITTHGSIVLESRATEARAGCTHPRDRQRNAANGKLCLDCHTILPL